MGVPRLKCSRVGLFASSPRSFLAVGVPLQSLTRCFVVPPCNSGCDPSGVVVAWGLSCSTSCDPSGVKIIVADRCSAFDPEGVTACSIRSTTKAFDPPHGGVAAGVAHAQDRLAGFPLLSLTQMRPRSMVEELYMSRMSFVEEQVRELLSRTILNVCVID